MTIGFALAVSLAVLFSMTAMTVVLRRERHLHFLTRSFLRKESEDNRILRRQLSTLEAERDFLRSTLERMTENAS